MTINKYGIVFPGQGSQHVGMLAEIASQYDEVKKTFDEAATVLGYDLWELVQQGPAEKLDLTTYTQPALLAASYAVWRIIQSQHKIHPVILAGHSLGEYTALVCAEALSFSDALTLVAARGRFMQEAVSPGMGAMAAIVGLEEAIVSDLCQQAKESHEEVLSPANFNSIGQIVIAGHKEAVIRAITLAKEKGAKLAVILPVSVPSHCQLMKPAAKQLAALLETVTLHTPRIPVINNVDVKEYTDAQSIHDGLVRQLSMPVRWVEIVQAFTQIGVTHIIECGPGKVLTGLNKRINKNLQLMTTSDLANLETLNVA